jgi:hypothetical protein
VDHGVDVVLGVLLVCCCCVVHEVTVGLNLLCCTVFALVNFVRFYFIIREVQSQIFYMHRF